MACSTQRYPPGRPSRSASRVRLPGALRWTDWCVASCFVVIPCLNDWAHPSRMAVRAIVWHVGDGTVVWLRQIQRTRTVCTTCERDLRDSVDSMRGQLNNTVIDSAIHPLDCPRAVDVAAGEIHWYDPAHGGGFEDTQLANFRSYLNGQKRGTSCARMATRRAVCSSHALRAGWRAPHP